MFSSAVSLPHHRGPCTGGLELSERLPRCRDPPSLQPGKVCTLKNLSCDQHTNPHALISHLITLFPLKSLSLSVSPIHAGTHNHTHTHVCTHTASTCLHTQPHTHPQHGAWGFVFGPRQAAPLNRTARCLYLAAFSIPLEVRGPLSSCVKMPKCTPAKPDGDGVQNTSCHSALAHQKPKEPGCTVLT